MKLKAPQHFEPVRERVEFPGDLHAYLTDYARYYEAMHGATIALPELLVEIARAFLRTDREFWTWRRSALPPKTNAPKASPEDPGQLKASPRGGS